MHHIIDDDVRFAARWSDVAPMIIGGDDIIAFAAHSAEFERLWIPADLLGDRPIICTYKSALRLWPTAPRHSNQALRYWRQPFGLDRQIASVAHRAFPDAYVTAFHLRDMLGECSLQQLIEWSAQPALLIHCNIGAHRGKRWEDVDSGFLEWILSPGKDFDEGTLFTARFHLAKREAEAKAEHEKWREEFEPKAEAGLFDSPAPTEVPT